MSNFLIFKAAFNNSATPAIGTYTAEGATAQFTQNASLSPDYYLYNTADDAAVQWFVPTAETTDFEFVADILTRQWTNRVTYFIIADSTGTTRLRMWSRYDSWKFENSDSTAPEGDPEYIGGINATTSGGFNVFHQFRVRVRKLTASSSSVEVYVDGTLKLTATAGASLITCAKMGFVGGVNTWGPGTGAGIKNAYVYDLSDGDVVNPGVLSGAFNRFISWMKSKFALKSDIPTVNDATLTIQQNGTTVDTFTANSSSDKTVNIECVDLTNNQTVAGNKEFTGTTTAHDLVPSATDTYNFGSSSYQWNNLYAKNYYYNGTEFQSKFVTTDTAQTVNGVKTFTAYVASIGSSTGDEYSGNASTNLWLMAKRDTDELSGVLIDTFRQNTAQGTGSHILGISIKENSARYEGCRFTWIYDNSINGYVFSLLPTKQGANLALKHNLGTSTDKWSTINGINPSSLGMPDLDNGIDISGYITVVNNANKESFYTPTVNGWISVALTRTGGSSMAVMLKQGNFASSGHNIAQENGTTTCNAMLPVKGGVQVSINSALADGIAFAYFYPCQGNV